MPMTRRKKQASILASLVLLIAGFLVISIPALRRAQCGAFSLQVAQWQRGMLQNTHARYEEGNGPPSSFLRIMAEVSPENYMHTDGLEIHCWNQTNEPARIGSITLEALLRSKASLEDVDAEVVRLGLPVPRWEVFGGLAFLVYDRGEQFRAELPVMLASMGFERPICNVGFEDGHVMLDRLYPERVAQLQSELSLHNLPPLPDSFLSRLPK